ncbi:MAG: hypothetical protein LBT50_06560 [Prevotellaceae bacterium]|jgi:hypothetical protein|nr:hypothetical protein [Prevotellaceae bacterium]
MATILESLKSLNGYPVPVRTFGDIAVRRGLALDDDATENVLKSASYMLAKADILKWISFAPNISQEGISYDLLYSDREQMRKQANAIYGDMGDDSYIHEAQAKFGYKGSGL